MRSEKQGMVQRQTQVRDRFGAVLAASMSMLCVAAVIGLIPFFVWGQTQESAGLAYNPLGIIVLVLAAPFLAAAGAVLAALLSIGAVMPLVVAAGWCGRRLCGREAWWWVPVLAVAATVPLALAAAALVEADALVGLGGWLAMTATFTVAALVCRRLLLLDRPRLSGGVMFGRVARYGTLAVATAGTVAVVGLSAGLGYEPPRLGAERVTGTWSDDTGGALILTADGRATATRVKTFELDDSFETVTRECTGTGTWEYDPGTGPYSQEVIVSVDDCRLDTWEVLGTFEHPKLFVYIGDPDSWDLYVLQQRDQAPPPGSRREEPAS